MNNFSIKNVLKKNTMIIVMFVVYIFFVIIRWFVACLVVANYISLKFKDMYLIVRLILGLVLKNLNATIGIFKFNNKMPRSIPNAFQKTIELCLMVGHYLK